MLGLGGAAAGGGGGGENYEHVSGFTCYRPGDKASINNYYNLF